MAADSFNRADAGDLGSNWQQQDASNILAVTSNRAYNTPAGDLAAAYFTGQTFLADQASAVVISRIAGVDFKAGPLVRASGIASAYTHYWLRIADGTAWSLRYHLNGVVIANILSGTSVFADGDEIRLEVVGQQLRCYQNGTLLGSVIHAGIATGQPGIGISNVPDARIDDWQGFDLIAAVSPFFTQMGSQMVIQ